MDTPAFNFPPQRLSFKEKTKNDMDWAKQVIKMLKLNYVYTNDIYDNMIANYDLYNNKLSPKDFEYTCKLLAIKEDSFPQLEVYNKTSNKINVLLSEEERRPFEYKAILINEDGIKTKVLERQNELQAILQKYVEALLQNPDEEIQEELEKIKESKYLSSKEITANKLLDYLYRKLDLKGVKNDAFKHGLISGMEVVWVGVQNNNPIVQVVNPTGFFYHKSGDTKFIEDGLFAGYTCYMTVGDILDKYGDYMTDEECTRIESHSKGYASGEPAVPRSTMEYHHEDYSIGSLFQFDVSQGNKNVLRGQYGWSTYADIRVTHVEWKSQMKVGYLRHVSPETGDEVEELVSEDFVIPKYAVKKKNPRTKTYEYFWDIYSFEWGWMPQVWEGIVILDNIFVKVGPKEFQFRSLDNPHSVKLGYHGTLYSATNSSPVSVMDRMKPFQYLYTMLMFKMKKLISMDKPPAIGFDTSMIDPSLGIEKTLYYLEEIGIDFYNSLENSDKLGGSNRSGKLGSSVGRSTMQYIQNYIAIMDAIDNQIGDVAGVNRQREGQVAPTEAVTNVQTQITQSSVITELMFQLHFKVWERVLGTLVELSKTTWKTNKSLQYILDDMSLMTLRYNPDELLDVDLGIFLTNTSKEHMVLHQLQQLGLTLMQNDKVDLGSYINMLSTSSLEAVKEEIKHSQKKAEKLQQQMIQQQNEQAEMQNQMLEEAKAKEREFELLKLKVAHEYAMAEKEIESYKFVDDQDANDDGLADQLQIEELKLKHNQQKQDFYLKNRELDIKKTIANKPTPKKS